MVPSRDDAVRSPCVRKGSVRAGGWAFDVSGQRDGSALNESVNSRTGGRHRQTLRWLPRERFPFRLIEARGERRVYSFDVFDTALTRRVLPPSAAWLWLGRDIVGARMTAEDPVTVAHLRTRAEQDARQAAAPHGQATLAEIAEVFASALGLPERHAQALVDLELKLEEQLLIAVPGMSRRLEQLRDRGYTIAFISETYLPSTFVRDMLAMRGLLEPEEPVIVSCEARASKRDGGLYLAATTSLGLSTPRGLWHHGDDPRNDVEAPRRVGATATPLDVGRATAFEVRVARHRRTTEGWTARLAAAARRARLELRDELPRADPVSLDVATGAAAPALIAYVSWVLETCQSAGLPRVNFLARDGQVLFRIAEALQRGRFRPLQLSYLLVSRSSTYPLDIESARIGARRLLRTHAGLTRSQLVEWLGLNSPRCGPQAQKNKAEQPEAPLKESERGAWEAWLEGSHVAEATASARAAGRDLLADYLRQQGALDGGAQALVDVGWTGRVSSILCDVAEEANGTQLTPLFFGLVAGAMRHAPARSRAYLFDGREGEVEPFLAVQELLEVLCLADHPQVAGYARERDGSVSVRLRRQGHTPPLLAGLPVRTFQDAVVRVAEHLVADAGAPPSGALLRSMAGDVLTELCDRPNRAVARALGSTAFASGALDQAPEPIAAPYRPHEAIAALRHVGLPVRYWPQGSAALTGAGTLTVIRAAQRARRRASGKRRARRR